MRQGIPRLVIPPHLDGSDVPPPPPDFDRAPFWDDPPPRMSFEAVFGAISVAAVTVVIMMVIGFAWWVL